MTALLIVAPPPFLLSLCFSLFPLSLSLSLFCFSLSPSLHLSLSLSLSLSFSLSLSVGFFTLSLSLSVVFLPLSIPSPSFLSWSWLQFLCPSGELADAIRSKTNLHFGLYHSLFEWFNPLFLKDKASNFSTQDFVDVSTFVKSDFLLTLCFLYEVIL